jgi:DNA-binding SARP family transcriptional activator/predicted ATPase
VTSSSSVLLNHVIQLSVLNHITDCRLPIYGLRYQTAVSQTLRKQLPIAFGTVFGKIYKMSQLRLLFLGPPRIERGGQIVEVDTRKATALLAYLALSGERPSRDFLAAFLWPEFDDSRAKAALRRTLSALKAAVGEGVIYATREQIGLEPDVAWCDVVVFHQFVDQGELTAAVSLYRDDFLTGFSLRDSISFDDWQQLQQENLRRELAQALAKLSQTTAGETAVAYARRWCLLDPLLEEAHRRLMQLYAANGRHADALRQYRECVRILDEELGVSPLPETTDLYHAIQNNRVTRDQNEGVNGWAMQASRGERVKSVTRSPAHPFTPSLIGRDDELYQMQQFYRQAGADGRLLIIEGEPGIGKTRLAEALVEWAAASGAAVLSARCYEGETNLAYAPIIQALQDGLVAGVRDRVDALPVQHVAGAARLLPQLAEGRTLPALPTLGAPGEQVRFYDGVTHLLAALLAGPVPGILWLDDVHWLDAASQELLLYLLHRLAKRPFLVLFCWRAEDLPAAHPLRLLAATLRRAGASDFITPRRFTVDQVQTLLTISGLTFPADFPQRLFTETEGLPFFVVEYLNALQPENGRLAAETALTIPVTVRDLLHKRLVQIGETERQILQTAAAIGHSFDLGLVQAGSGRSPEEAVTALEMLAWRGLLAEHVAAAATPAQAVYDFSHDKLRTLVYEGMGPARRRLLHRRLADTLAAQRTPTTAVSAQIAAHYQLAGLEAEAAVYFVQAGDQARALFAHRDALHYYRSALALGADDAWHLHAACAELSTRLGVYPDALSSYETAAALAPAAALGKLEHQLAQVYHRQGSWSLAEQTLVQAQEHLGDTAAPAALAHLFIDRTLVAHRQKQPEEALALAQQARALAETAGDEPMLALAYNILGMLARSRGELETAVSFLEKSYRLADSGDRLDIQIAVRNNLALTFSAVGQIAAARTNLEEALALCERYGDRHYEAALRSNLADLLHQAGDKAAAQEQVKQSVTIYAEIGREEETWRAEIWQLTEW